MKITILSKQDLEEQTLRSKIFLWDNSTIPGILNLFVYDALVRIAE